MFPILLIVSKVPDSEEYHIQYATEEKRGLLWHSVAADVAPPQHQFPHILDFFKLRHQKNGDPPGRKMPEKLPMRARNLGAADQRGQLTTENHRLGTLQRRGALSDVAGVQGSGGVL